MNFFKLLGLISITVSLIKAPFAQADFDLKLSSALRTYPLGGGLTLETGYNFLIWGEGRKFENPFYGYLRPYVELNSSGTYNSAESGMEFFPLSFLGVRGGGMKVRNDKDYSDHDCDPYQCVGDFEKGYVEGQLLLGYASVFAAAIVSREWWKSSEPIQKDFIDPVSSLAIAQEGEELQSLKAILGYRISENWSLIYAGYFCRDSDLEQSAKMNALSLAWSGESWNASIGAGSFESDLKQEGFTALGRIQWILLPSLGLL